MGERQEVDHKLDLSEVPGDLVRTNQARPSGESWMISVDGVLEEYFYDNRYDRATRFERLLAAETNWIEEFVGHAPTVGSHHECILRDIMAQYLPGNVRLGTGFVYDSLRSRCSPQIDVLLYSDMRQSPIYRRGEFVIVDTKSVMGVSEVKKELRTAHLVDSIKKTIGENLGNNPLLPFGVQTMAIFAFKCGSSTQTLVENIREQIDLFLSSFTTKTKGGHSAELAVFQMVLPSVYILDREEFITVNVMRETDRSHAARFSVDVCVSPTGTGLAPFLSDLHPTLPKPVDRDFVASYLCNTNGTCQVNHSAYLVRRLTTGEMLEKFTDAKEILRKKGPNGEQAYGAIVSSFLNVDEYSSLHSLSATNGFSWLVFKPDNLRH